MNQISEQSKIVLEQLNVSVIHKDKAKELLWGLTKKQRLEIVMELKLTINGKESTREVIELIIDNKFKSFCFGFNK